MYDAKTLLQATLDKQTPSVREWATTAHNGPIWLKICENSLKEFPTRPFEDAVLRMSAFMVAVCYGM